MSGQFHTLVMFRCFCKFVKFARKKCVARIWDMVRRAARWVLTRPELLIPAKNDKADKFAAEQGESHQSCKMPWKVILATFLLEM